MESFKSIYERALERKGGKAALERQLPKTRSARALAATKNDRWLAEMTRCVFQAGFVWRVVEHKWDDFEDVFFGFPPEKIILSLEMRMKCGIGMCGRCNIGKEFVCKDGPVFTLEELNKTPKEY